MHMFTDADVFLFFTFQLLFGRKAGDGRYRECPAKSLFI